MNAPDRIGEHLPELLGELATPRVPDYFDDLLRTTAATSQLPSWASLERWLPMGAVARPAPLGLPSWRPILVAVSVALALVAIGLVVGGAQPHRPAPPFGLARNGMLLAGTTSGELVSIDPATGARTAIPTDEGGGYFPWFAPDGTKYLRSRIADGVEIVSVVDADGTGAREVFRAPQGAISFLEWSPAGDRFIVSMNTAGRRTAAMVDVASGRATSLLPNVEMQEFTWRPNGKEIVLKGDVKGATGDAWAYYLASVDGSQFEPIVPVLPDERYFAASLSPDGRFWVYSKFTPTVRGRLYQVDIDAGTEQPLDVAGATAGTRDVQPQHSPDGSLLAVERFTDSGYTTTLVRTDGTGRAVPLGNEHRQVDANPQVLFSPDGARVAVHHPDDGSTWLYDTATGTGIGLQGAPLDGLTWQRLAP